MPMLRPMILTLTLALVLGCAHRAAVPRPQQIRPPTVTPAPVVVPVAAPVTAPVSPVVPAVPAAVVPVPAPDKNQPEQEQLAATVREQEALIKKQQALLAQMTKRLTELCEANLDALGPKDRKSAILKLLDDPLPELRRLAATEARKALSKNDQTADPVLVEKLLALLPDDAEAVRIEVTSVLAAVHEKRVSDALLTRLSEEPKVAVRAAIITALGDLREPRAVGPLVKLLGSSDEVLVARAATALGQIGERGTPTAEVITPAVKPLSELLERNTGIAGSLPVREAVVRALSKIARPESLPMLLAAIDDPTPGVRFFAAQGLGHLGQNGPRVIDVLVKHLTDSDKGVRAAVADTLGKMADSKVDREIVARLNPPAKPDGNGTSGETDPEVRTALWTALVAIEKRSGEAKAIEKLADELEGNADVAGAAATMQLYEIAISKLAPSQEADVARLRSKLVEACVRAGQPAKAAALLREDLAKTQGVPEQAALNRRLGLILLKVPPYIEGTEILAREALTAGAGDRDQMLAAIYDLAAQLVKEGKLSEAQNVLARAREIASATWGGSKEGPRLESLFASASQSLFDQAVGKLRAEDAAARKQAGEDARRVVKAQPAILMAALRAALASGNADRVAALEPLLSEVPGDLTAYRAAKTVGEKLQALKSWKVGGEKL